MARNRRKAAKRTHVLQSISRTHRLRARGLQALTLVALAAGPVALCLASVAVTDSASAKTVDVVPAPVVHEGDQNTWKTAVAIDAVVAFKKANRGDHQDAQRYFGALDWPSVGENVVSPTAYIIGQDNGWHIVEVTATVVSKTGDLRRETYQLGVAGTPELSSVSGTPVPMRGSKVFAPNNLSGKPAGPNQTKAIAGFASAYLVGGSLDRWVTTESSIQSSVGGYTEVDVERTWTLEDNVIAVKCRAVKPTTEVVPIVWYLQLSGNSGRWEVESFAMPPSMPEVAGSIGLFRPEHKPKNKQRND